MSKHPKVAAQPALRILLESEVARQVRQHARSAMKIEVCGVLIGREEGTRTIVEACIAGENAAQGGAHVTFTQDTWEHIYQIKDKEYPDARIVGWYHSHPGFGVFLSDHDLFIHQNFFGSPQQIAWVYDPHNDEEGCFGWHDGKIVKIDDVSVRFDKEPAATTALEDPEAEEVQVKIKGKPGEEKIDWAEILRYGAICAMFFIVGAAAMFYYIRQNFVPFPRGATALVLLQDDKVTPIPPEIAERVLIGIQHEMDLQRLQQMTPTPQPPGSPTTPNSNPQGEQNGRPK